MMLSFPAGLERWVATAETMNPYDRPWKPYLRSLFFAAMVGDMAYVETEGGSDA